MLGVYVNANTALTHEEKRIRILASAGVSILMLLGLAWSIYDSMQFSQRINDDLDMQMKKLDADLAEMDREATRPGDQAQIENLNRSDYQMR